MYWYARVIHRLSFFGSAEKSGRLLRIYSVSVALIFSEEVESFLDESTSGNVSLHMSLPHFTKQKWIVEHTNFFLISPRTVLLGEISEQ